jgi:hypothetical protein
LICIHCQEFCKWFLFWGTGTCITRYTLNLNTKNRRLNKRFIKCHLPSSNDSLPTKIIQGGNSLSHHSWWTEPRAPPPPYMVRLLSKVKAIHITNIPRQRREKNHY